jgi:hypothetical protein
MLEQSEQAHEGLNSKQWLVVVLVNALLLAELTFSIYLGHQDPESMTAIFLRTFVPMVAVTLVLARICLKRLGTR